jgi:hypothetical protein
MIALRLGALALVILSAFSGSSGGPATPRNSLPAFEHLDECVNPILENMSWGLVQGVVVEVTSVRTLRLRTDAGHIANVIIPNIADQTNPEATRILRSRVRGKRVSVVGNSHRRDGIIVGEVQDAEGNDVARELLRTGITSFVPAEPYTLSSYSECLNRIAEREAKAQRLGIWRDAGAH